MKIKNMHGWIMAALAVIGVLAVSPRDAAARWCAKCSDDTQGQYIIHYFGDSGAFFECTSGEGCHQGNYYNMCAKEHENLGCGPISRATSIALRRAINQGEPDALMSKVAKLAGNAAYNESIGTVDVFDCEGSLIARMKVPAGLRAKLGQTASLSAT